MGSDLEPGYNRSSFYGQIFMYSCWGLGQKQLTKHSFGCHGFHFGSKGYFSFFSSAEYHRLV